ncbi:pitrilysin family protein [Sulfurovum sp. XTW-4]|uniref:Pitrilysin family protein n=1 Tax=Sulfurovum xiamenensis TaxID=3019066 RepID=A0ABT7QP95_9BACT|nr:pitrilysin family protein [Sulfurovum xiamenensis]MDM5262902.1 pitrilysin family protein [Sulfurovum xiamenensis]
MAAFVQEIEIKGSKVPVVFEQEKYLPIVSIQLIFQNAGHLSNTKDGLADMSARLMNEGTSKEGSVGFATKLDAHAVEIGAHVGRESFVIEVSSLKSEFPYAVERLEELLKDPNYTKEALSHIKHQKIGWLTQKKSDFDYIAGTSLRETLFKGSVLARPYDGTIESIESISLEDIQTFISTHLGYNNAIGVVGGDITLDEAQGYLTKLLAVLPKVEEKEIKSIQASDKKEVVLIDEDTQQAYIYFGAPFNYSYKEKDQYLAKIAEYLLGGAGFGSRLMEEIRVKRGLTYGVYSSFRRTKPVSYLSGYMQTKLSTQDEAKDLIQEVVDTFVKEGITQKELDDTKKFLLGSEPLRTETLSQRLHRAYNDYYYGRPLDFSKEQLKKIESVTLDEVNAFIKAHTELSDITFSIVTKKEAAPKK